jgi:hypothetical protein
LANTDCCPIAGWSPESKSAGPGRAFDLLLALIERRERPVAKDELLSVVWPGRIVEEGNLTVHIAGLRKLLVATSSPRCRAVDTSSSRRSRKRRPDRPIRTRPLNLSKWIPHRNLGRTVYCLVS